MKNEILFRKESSWNGMTSWIEVKWGWREHFYFWGHLRSSEHFCRGICQVKKAVFVFILVVKFRNSHVHRWNWIKISQELDKFQEIYRALSSYFRNFKTQPDLFPTIKCKDWDGRTTRRDLTTTTNWETILGSKS